MPVNLSLNLNYFAIMREQRGLAAERLETAAATPRALYAELAAKYCFTLPVDRIGVAINETFADLDQPLNDNDAVAFIPPVAGG